MADDKQGQVVPTPPPNPEPGASPPAPAPAQPSSPTPPPPAPEQRYVPAERFEAVVAQKFDAIRQSEEFKARALELERRLQEFASRAAQPAQPPQPWQQPQAAPQQPQITQADIERLSTARAAQIDFNRRCNESVFAGRKSYGDFDAKITALKGVAPGLDANGQPMLPQHFVEAALATKRAEHVLYALANDLGEADRIMSLGPMEQAVELTRLADKVAPSEGGDVVSQAEQVAAAARANRPIPQVVGAGRGAPPAASSLALDDPNLPIEEFMRRRGESAWDAKRVNGRRWPT